MNITAEMINIMEVILIVFFSFLNQNITQQLPFSGQVFQETYIAMHAYGSKAAGRKKSA